MLKILQINVCCNVYSTGKIAEQIGATALKNGWDSYIAYARGFKPSKSKTIKIGNSFNVYMHYIENRLFDREGLSSRIATLKLIKEIKRIQPDIVQLHNLHDHYLSYKMLFDFLNKTDINVVWTFHDCWAFTGHCFHFVTKKCERWKSGCYDCPLRYEYPSTLIDRSKKNYSLKKALFSNSNKLTIVSCSKWMDDFVKKSFLKDKKSIVIHNGVDLGVFKSKEKYFIKKKDSFDILAVSTVWNKEKGIEDIYQLRRNLPENFKITIVGLTEEQIKSLPDGIYGIQRTQNQQVLVDLYASSDVFINPTYADTFPTVNLEALACGTPVITYNTGGSPEALDENTGIVVEQGDIKSLTEAIIRMKSKPLSPENCRLRAELLFNKDNCYDEYIKLYENILRS